MKILVNRKIKRLFLQVLLAAAVYLAASVFILCLGPQNAVIYVGSAAALMVLFIFAALYRYFQDQKAPDQLQ